MCQSFSYYSSPMYCLEHLFTARSEWVDDNSLLGLSYIANPNLAAVGGICTGGNHGNCYANTSTSGIMINLYILP